MLTRLLLKEVDNLQKTDLDYLLNLCGLRKDYLNTLNVLLEKTPEELQPLSQNPVHCVDDYKEAMLLKQGNAIHKNAEKKYNKGMFKPSAKKKEIPLVKPVKRKRSTNKDSAYRLLKKLGVNYLEEKPFYVDNTTSVRSILIRHKGVSKEVLQCAIIKYSRDGYRSFDSTGIKGINTVNSRQFKIIYRAGLL
jgi:hypothetical protein